MIMQADGILKLHKVLNHLERQEKIDFDSEEKARQFLEKQFQNRTGRKPDLDSPRSFNEKLQWMKLNWRDERAALCADKLTARNYVRQKGCQELLHPMLAVWHSAEEMDFEGLPDSFIIKATHASGLNLIVQNKQLICPEDVKVVFRRILDLNYSALKGEWVYMGQKPALICEALYSDYERGQLDYKFFCFDGHIRYVQVLTAIDTHDFTDDTQAFFCDENLKALPVNCGYDAPKGALTVPACYEKMKETAEILARGFPFVRVDFCVDNGKPWFGEFTFFPGAGYDNYLPYEFEMEMGAWLKTEA